MRVKDMSEVPSDYSGRVVIKRKDGSTRVVTYNNEISRTDEQWAEDCDVNTIVRKFRKTKVLPTHLNHRQGVFADVTQVVDLHTSVIKLQEAQDEFEKLPALVRKRFDNNALKMIQFLEDSSNDDEAIKLGLKQGRTDSTLSAADKAEGRVSPQKSKKTPQKEEPVNDDE